MAYGDPVSSAVTKGGKVIKDARGEVLQVLVRALDEELVDLPRLAGGDDSGLHALSLTVKVEQVLQPFVVDFVVIGDGVFGITWYSDPGALLRSPDLDTAAALGGYVLSRIYET